MTQNKSKSPTGAGGAGGSGHTVGGVVHPHYTPGHPPDQAARDEALTFLRALYDDDPPPPVLVFLLPSKATHWPATLEQAADIAVHAARRKQNVYVSVGLQREKPKQGRGSADTVAALPGLWGDVDFHSPAHTATDLPPDEKAALQLIGEFPLPPTLLVHSGHGLQPWWLFKEPWVFDSDDERRAATDLARRWQATLQAKARAHGWRIDATADLARVLRMPGTTNWKIPNAPVPVRLLYLNSHRYNPGDFEPYLVADAEEHAGAHAPAPPVGEVIPEGQRNTTLTSLAGSMRRRGLDEATIPAALRSVNAARCVPPLPDNELATIARSVARYEPAVAPPPVNYRQTDLGNAERLAARHGHDLRYCHPWGRWLVWDGRRWAIDDTGEVYRRAKETVRSIYVEASFLADETERKARAKWAIGSESRARLENMVILARREPGIHVLPDELDANPWLLTVRNGTLDLRTGELRPHNRADLITRLVDIDYDPNAKAPLWLAFLDRIMAGNTALIAFLRRAVGYSLTGNTSERVLFFLYGTGDNGKSTFLETIRAVAGDYGLRTPTETLLTKREGSIPNDVARLKGARLVTAAEAEEGRRLAEALVKDITGGDTISARFLHAEWFDFRPQCKIWLATNHRPTVRGTDKAIWNRIKLIPFTVTIPKEKQDQRLREKLEAELPGILAWAVRGCLEWQEQGLNVPEAVVRATEQYREEMDVLGGFIADCCELSPTAHETTRVLYQGYVSWCEANGEKPIGKAAFGMRLTERGFSQYRDRKERGWVGIQLISPEPKT